MTSSYVPSSDYVYYLPAMGLAEEALAEHVADADGHCVRCGVLGFEMPWPCRASVSARAAAELAASWKVPRPG